MKGANMNKINKYVNVAVNLTWVAIALFGIVGVIMENPAGIVICEILVVMWTLTRIFCEGIDACSLLLEEK
jgi:hypothetical protein